jgi:phage shock protein A
MSLSDQVRALEAENVRLRKQVASVPESTSVLLHLVQKLEAGTAALKAENVALKATRAPSYTQQPQHSAWHA